MICPMKNKHISKTNCPVGALDRDPQTGRFKKGTHWRPHSKHREKRYLEIEYLDKGRSASEIAGDNGVTENAVLFWLSKHGIPRRTVSEARKLKKWGSVGSDNPMFGKCGDKNPRWIDGSSPERQKMYARSFWKEIIKTIYKRDNYKCLRCHKGHTKGNRLHAHHVKPWAGNPSSRFSLSNIITLCGDCHQWVHSLKNKNNEFLSR